MCSALVTQGDGENRVRPPLRQIYIIELSIDSNNWPEQSEHLIDQVASEIPQKAA